MDLGILARSGAVLESSAWNNYILLDQLFILFAELSFAFKLVCAGMLEGLLRWWGDLKTGKEEERARD